MAFLNVVGSSRTGAAQRSDNRTAQGTEPQSCTAGCNISGNSADRTAGYCAEQGGCFRINRCLSFPVTAHTAQNFRFSSAAFQSININKALRQGAEPISRSGGQGDLSIFHRTVKVFLDKTQRTSD